MPEPATKVRQIGFVCLVCGDWDDAELDIESAVAIVDHIEKAHPEFKAEWPRALALLRERAQWLDFVTRWYDDEEALP